MTRYICLNCLHEWDSGGAYRVMRCSYCHRRQGVSYDRFRKAVDAAKTALRRVAESPPPRRPPLEVVADIPDALGPVLELARNEFPNPLVPVSLFQQILKCAVQELKDLNPADSRPLAQERTVLEVKRVEPSKG